MSDAFAPPPPVGRPYAVPPPAAPAPRPPRVGLWVSIIAGIILIAGLSVALWWEFGGNRFALAERGDTGEMAAMQVIEGMCLADAVGADGSVGAVRVVDCHEPHLAEVVARMKFVDGEWPGYQRVRTGAMDFCTSVMTPGGGIIDDDPTTLSLTWVVWQPTPQTWSHGDRSAVCVVSHDAPATGSLYLGN